jgi:hypothetical protein
MIYNKKNEYVWSLISEWVSWLGSHRKISPNKKISTTNRLLHQKILGSKERLGLIKKNWPSKKTG